MKKILTVATGGTIGSSQIEGCRRLNVGVAKSILLENFKKSGSPLAKYGEELFVDSGFQNKTLSENMTPEGLFEIYRHIRSFELSEYSGVIVLHGTDTLAFSSAFLSVVLSRINLPLVLVSGNKPPHMSEGNANVNFQTAVELISEGLAPNVYAVYQNSDGVSRLHLGSTLMQCENFTDDFKNAREENVICLNKENHIEPKDIERLIRLSKKRALDKYEIPPILECPREGVLMLRPYVGLDYSKIDLKGISAAVHGTYHSGTVCACTEDSPYSVISFGKACREREIQLYVAPCVLDENQYESAYEAQGGGAIPLNTTAELAYCKALVGLSLGLCGDKLTAFLTEEINNEFI